MVSEPTSAFLTLVIFVSLRVDEAVEKETEEDEEDAKRAVVSEATFVDLGRVENDEAG